jgi:hypothetical protein
MKEDDIKRIVQREIADCFSELKKDVAELKANQVVQAASLRRIEAGLFGDRELSIVGLAEKIEVSYVYVKHNMESRIIDRAEVALSEFHWFAENKEMLTEITEKYKAIKLLFLLTGITGVVSFVNLIVILLDLFDK